MRSFAKPIVVLNLMILLTSAALAITPEALLEKARAIENHLENVPPSTESRIKFTIEQIRTRWSAPQSFFVTLESYYAHTTKYVVHKALQNPDARQQAQWYFEALLESIDQLNIADTEKQELLGMALLVAPATRLRPTQYIALLESFIPVTQRRDAGLLEQSRIKYRDLIETKAEQLLTGLTFIPAAAGAIYILGANEFNPLVGVPAVVAIILAVALPETLNMRFANWLETRKPFQQSEPDGSFTVPLKYVQVACSQILVR